MTLDQRLQCILIYLVKKNDIVNQSLKQFRGLILIRLDFVNDILVPNLFFFCMNSAANERRPI